MNIKYLSISLVSVTMLSAAIGAVPAPVTYFSFDEVSGESAISDLSGGGHDLTLGSGAYITNLSAVGNALWFDGSQNAWATFTPPVVTNRTISFWYWRNCNPGPYFSDNWNTGDNQSNNSMPTLISELGTLRFRFGNQWEDSSNQSLGLKNKQVIPWFGTSTPIYLPVTADNYANVGFCRWVHYALTFNVKSRTPSGNNTEDVVDCAFYVNGEKFYECSGQTTYNCVSDALATLGNRAANGLRPSCGSIDEFRIFDSVLSESQIREEFARGSSAQRQRLIAWYPLQEFSVASGDGSFTTPDKTDYGIANALVMTCSSETSVVPGPGGDDKALHFQGTDGTIATATVPWPADDFTVSAWVNVSTNTSIIRIAGQTSNFPPFFRYGTAYVAAQTPLASASVGYCLPGGTASNVNDNKGIVGKGNWQHVAWVVRNIRKSIDSSANSYTQKLEIYLNGEHSTDSPEATAAVTARGATLYLGSRGPSSHRVFEGEICDFRIYDGAMSSNEVQKLFRGAAAVDAGPDATVRGAAAVLSGTVAARSSAQGIRVGYAGDVSWTLVSAPVGAGVSFARPHNPVTEVMLPVEGTYVFKLATVAAFGAVSEDTVTIVRDDANGSPSAASAVDVDAAASNALLAASLENDLVRHWDFNRLVTRELVTGARFNLGKIDWSHVMLTNGVSGSALGTYGGVGCVVTNTVDSGELAGTSGKVGYPTGNEWYSVSAWIRPEPGYPEDWYSGAILSIHDSLNVCYGQWNNASSATGPRDGFSIQQKGISGAVTYLDFNLPSGKTLQDIEGGWHHLAALVNRHDTSKCKLYLDGASLAVGSSSTGNYGTLTGDGAMYSNTPMGGRYRTDKVTLCNILNDSAGNPNNMSSYAKNTSTGTTYYRHFPGVIDEVRCYTRELTDAEIGYLAANPDLLSNDAPSVGKVESERKWFVKNRAQSVSASVADDGQPDGTLTYEWLVVSGDVSAVSFADASAAETTVTISEKGTYTFMLKASDGERITYGPPKTIDVQGPGTFVIIR